MSAFTLAHVVISLVGIASGLVVMYGLLTARRLENWTAVFLATTLATSVTGFFFPVDHFLPSHGIGLVSLVVLGVAIFARYRRHMDRSWRWIYVVAAVLALYLNVFVLVVQSFLRVPVLNAMAPTQSEPPLQITQLLVLAVFVVIGIAAVVRFRTGTAGTIAPPLRPQPIAP